MSLNDLYPLFYGLVWTVTLTASAFLIGSVLGALLLLARSGPIWIFRFLAMVLIQIIRGLPPLLWLFIIFFGVGMGIMPVRPFTAALIGFSLIAAANMAEIYRGALASIPHGQWEASAALGLGMWSTIKDVVAPQLLRVALPSAAAYLIGLLKETAIASVIGVTDLAFFGRQLSQLTFKGLEVYAVVGLLYIALSVPIAWASRAADSRLRSRIAR